MSTHRSDAVNEWCGYKTQPKTFQQKNASPVYIPRPVTLAVRPKSHVKNDDQFQLSRDHSREACVYLQGNCFSGGARWKPEKSLFFLWGLYCCHRCPGTMYSDVG